jgi:hypothetical protein
MGGVLRVPCVRMLGAYNEVLASGVCVAWSVQIMREKAQLRVICLVGWATMCERGVPRPLGLTSQEGGRRSYTCPAQGPRSIVLCRVPKPSPVSSTRGTA